MSIMKNNRVILKDGGTLTDLSFELNNVGDLATPFVLTYTQELFVGSRLPFNHRYIQIGTANSNAAAFSVSLWDGSSDTFVSAVDLIDNTAVSGVPLARSGILSWELAKQERWSRDDTENMTGELDTLTIYELFWAKIVTSADFSGGTTLDFIAWKFGDDGSLKRWYPDLDSSGVKEQFESGKTTWDDQFYDASNSIFRNLQRIYDTEFANRNQILRWDQLEEAAVHWVASVIYQSHGNDGRENRDNARLAFAEALNLSNLVIDRNQNTRQDFNEAVPSFILERR